MNFQRYAFPLLAGLTCAIACDASADNYFTLGVEGFRDRYEESGIVDSHADYGSVTAAYRHENNGFFSELDGRYSYGKNDYKSPSGTLDNVPQYEGEVRERSGIMLKTWHGTVMPYIGIGGRFFLDSGKGYFTNTGSFAYDRHITQFYAPIGASYQFTSGNWTFTPNVEYDFMFYGRVSSHLGQFPGYYNIVNNQHSGNGFRGEFMVGQKYTNFQWEAGPYVRYWSIKNSDVTTTPDGRQWIEPQNTRLQTGAALRVTY
jgi:hypothetical protein